MTHATVIQLYIHAAVITNTTDVTVAPTIVRAAVICGEENAIYFKNRAQFHFSRDHC